MLVGAETSPRSRKRPVVDGAENEVGTSGTGGADLAGKRVAAGEASIPLKRSTSESKLNVHAHTQVVSEQERKRSAAVGSVVTSLEKLGYRWEQTDEQVRIFLSAAAASEDGEVQCSFQAHSCSLSVTIGPRRYVYELKKTYAEIDPSASRVRVPKHRRHLEIQLAKRQPGEDWASLQEIAVEGSFLRAMGCFVE